ncbi:MAG: hypothetical protein M3O01_16850 [Pseudomonadota bacterium]|nr:hypothetical protein [Pseudomonadota bacterium]
MKVAIVYVVFCLLAPLAFWRWRPAAAVLVVFLGGWLVLPVGHFPAGSAGSVFPYWITGLAVPSDMLLTKAWVAPGAALIGALAFDRRRWANVRPAWCDAPIALWCGWPLLQGAFISASDPPSGLACLYLGGAWGVPWCLGRVYFSDAAAQRLLARGLALSALACLPIALLEGAIGPVVYDSLYEPHPFRLDGIERYFGFRPLAMFEDGNQYGIWISLCALAALWLAVVAEPGRAKFTARVVASVVSAMALAAQSVGALLMLATGCLFLSVCRWLRPRGMVAAAAALLVVAGALYVSGRVPITRLAKETALGHHVVEGLRGIGRGSLGWRVAQDQKLLPDAMARPLLGQGRWDWWRSRETRPWGLSVLVLGQFGLPGLAFLLGALLFPAARVTLRAPRSSGWSPAGLPLLLASVIGLSVVDALMNSFIFFPAVLIAGALAGDRTRPQLR